MQLHRIKDYDPNYRDYLGNDDILGFDVYSSDDKVGSVDDLIVDEEGNFRYLVLNTGLWIFGKKVLLPVGRARLAYADHRVYVDGMSREQVENLPEYDENLTLDYDYEERVRNVYRPSSQAATLPLDTGMTDTMGLDTGVTPANMVTAPPMPVDSAPYSYDRDRDLYDLDDENRMNLKLYQERLIANKTRHKTGEVSVGKRVETETARVDVPLEKERIVIERVGSTGSNVAVAPGEAAFRDGEVSRMEVYEEVADIHKEAFVREQVSVRKEVDRETATAEEKLRREELDVQTEGTPVVSSETNRQNNDPL
ncbi:PRC and DUF2382 domain-containing protein [Merismopedia glauca]|uniref:Photosystem reaction center subunit H n=1 Tax=Merismopedia glauca CCAP 1448/3 TaxID=1296344 RepID=A0A2T1C6N6_9CYAN|nr:DUF2382 domain-containing protein [Merismopedia glauca]PSB03803.1 photosystem reaction center subunit H [Merismopedia glauca CCAP 1448/3]